MSEDRPTYMRVRHAGPLRDHWVDDIDAGDDTAGPATTSQPHEDGPPIDDTALTGTFVILPAREVQSLFSAIAQSDSLALKNLLLELQRACGKPLAGSFGNRVNVTAEVARLSATQLDIFRRIVAGESRGEIAAATGRSKQAIYTQVFTIWNKLGTEHTDAALIHYAYRNGLVRL